MDWEEAVTAFVVAADGLRSTESDVIEHCRNELSKYKRTNAAYFADRLLVTVYGKLDKKALRKQLP